MFWSFIVSIFCQLFSDKLRNGFTCTRYADDTKKMRARARIKTRVRAKKLASFKKKTLSLLP